VFYLNDVNMIGRSTADAVVKDVSSTSKVATFRIVSNKRIKRKNGEKDEKSTFVDVEVWGQRAEYAGNYIKKGTPVLVKGELETDEWEKDGQRRSKLKIYGAHIQALRMDKKDASGDSSSDSKSSSDSSGDSNDPPF